jgi:adenosylcobinamide-GDP ribazoletransferase
MSVAFLTVAVVAAGFGLGGLPLAWRGLVAEAVGLMVGLATRRMAVRRLGGTTGDVFGAILEMTATATLVTCALLP